MIKTKTIVEILGTPKEHVEDSMKTVIEVMEKDLLAKIHGKEVFDAKEKDNVFSIFAEIDADFKNIGDMHEFCFKYMPSSVEILDPVELKIDSQDFTNATNDLLASIHNLDMMLKNSNRNMKRLDTSMLQLLDNFAFHLLEKPMDEKSLAKNMGLNPEQMDSILKALLEKGRIIKEEDMYKRK